MKARIAARVLSLAALGMAGGSVFVGGGGDETSSATGLTSPYKSPNRLSGIERANRSDARWTTTTSTTTTTLPPVSTSVRPAKRSGSQPTGSRPAPSAVANGDVLARIAQCESGGRYDAENPSSSASGKYQALDSTWDNYGGYARSSDAPPEVQEAWAREAYAKAGTRPWNSSRSCWR